MKNKKILSLAAIIGSTIAGASVLLTSNNLKGAFANYQTNEYGCVGDCTGEYEIRHVKQILQEHPELNGSQNVRFKVKVSKMADGLQWFQDVNDPMEFKKIKDVTNEARTGQLATSTSGIVQGLSGYVQGDVISFAGAVYWSKVYGNYTLDIHNLSIYRINEKEDLNYLPPVNYLI